MNLFCCQSFFLLSLECCCHSFKNLFSICLLNSSFPLIRNEDIGGQEFFSRYNLNFACCVSICITIIIILFFCTSHHKTSKLWRFVLPPHFYCWFFSFITHFIALLSEKSRLYSLLRGYFWGILCGEIFTVNYGNC